MKKKRAAISLTDMTHGKPFSLLFRFAVPMMIGGLFQQLYVLVESMIAGNLLGTQAQAAVGIGNYPQRVLLSLFIGLGTGATIRISQRIGQGDHPGVRRVVGTANALVLIVSIPVMGLGLLLAGPALRLMNAPEDAFPMAHRYLSIIFLGAMGMLGFNLNCGILRGMGDSLSPVLFLLSATIVNAALSILLVTVFQLGITGTALANVLTNMAFFLMTHRYIRKKHPQYCAPVWPIKLDREALSDIVRLGLPIGFNDSLFSLGLMFLSGLVNSHGTAFAAGYSVGNKLDSLSVTPLTSIVSALTTYTGQNVGAKRLDRVKQGVRTTVVMMLCWNAFACAFMLIFGRALISLFNPDPLVIDAGYAYIVRLEPFVWVYGLMMLLGGVLNGMGEVRVPVIANMILFWPIRLPVAYLLTRFAPANDLFFCYPISWTVGLFIVGAFYLRGSWKRRFDTNLR